VYKTNIGDCVRSQGESIGTNLDPPLFWLDNIFKSKMLNSASGMFILLLIFAAEVQKWDEIALISWKKIRESLET
jgi:hypothetical protein